MKVIPFEDLQYTDFHVKNLIAINKTVKNGQSFQVFDESRTTSVFVHLKDCNIRYNTDENEIIAEKGSIVYIPHSAKYEVTYNAEAAHDATAQLVAFEMHESENGQFIASDNIIKVCSAADNIYKDRFDEAVRISNGSTFEYPAFRTVLYSVISDLSNQACTKSVKSKDMFSILPSIEFLNRNECFDITISELAKLSHISEGCFRKQFKRLYGITPCEYINEKKIKAAKDLLQNGLYTVNEISELLGYTDSAYFSKVFKKTVGVSPMRYRSNFIL